MKNKLVIKLVDFHAAHYLPNKYGKCNRLHGHTYTFRNIEVTTEGVVDFAEIKSALEVTDHTLLVPQKDLAFWHSINQIPGCPCKIFPSVIDEEETTVEAIARAFEKVLLSVEGVKAVKFVLYETKGSGVRRPVDE